MPENNAFDCFLNGVDSLRTFSQKSLNETQHVGMLCGHSFNKQMAKKEVVAITTIENFNEVLSQLPSSELKQLVEFKKSPSNELPEKLKRIQNAADCLLSNMETIIKAPLYNSKFKMPKSVQDYWSINLFAEKTTKTKDHLHKKLAKAKLALNLNIGKNTKNKGTTGTVILTDVNGKPVGIAKFSAEYASLMIRIFNFIKSLFGQLSCLNTKDPMAQPKAEKAAYIVSKQLNFDVAPASEETILNKKAAVFQVFVKKEKSHDVLTATTDSKSEKQPLSPTSFYQEAITALNVINAPEKSFTENEKNIFQKFSFYDFLIGNLDRHGENWFVILNDKKEITHIKAIDNANAFPKKQPSKKSRAAQNQYKWKNLRIANETFTPEIREFVKENLSPGKIDNIIREINDSFSGNSNHPFLDQKMADLFRLRAATIRHFAGKKDSSPKNLANCSTEKEMLNIINKP